eukprot:TCONS_00068778-protein
MEGGKTVSQEEAANKFNLGNEAFVDEDFTTSIKCYTEALELDKENFDYYLKRCNAYIKISNFSDALSDVNYSIQYNTENSKAWQRKGLVLFSMEKFEEALEAYQKALELHGPNEDIQKYIRKCEAEINLTKQGSADQTKISIGLSSLHPTKESTIKDQGQMKQQEATQPATALKPKIKHDWYQTETHVILTVLAKSLKQEKVQIEFQSKSLSVTAKLPNGNDYSLELDLAHDIDPKDSRFKVLSTKIEIKMKKCEGIRWSSLETDNESQFTKNAKATKERTESTSGATSAVDVHKYPSSKHMYSDWDKLAKQLQEEEKTENMEGDAALNRLFQQIYSDGSDETKRAMNKSFQESGGTVLSTNWKDIKKEKVEVKPPDCMEYKKYEY